MEHMDPNVERQVWQRVMGQNPGNGREDLRGLQLGAMELAAVYRHLTGILRGRAGELARRLYEGERVNAACLRGMRMLSGGQEEKQWRMDPPKESAGKLLERCYHRTRRAAAEYMARSVDGEFGEVFRKMAEREGEQCAVIAELMGEMGR